MAEIAEGGGGGHDKGKKKSQEIVNTGGHDPHGGLSIFITYFLRFDFHFQ